MVRMLRAIGFLAGSHTLLRAMHVVRQTGVSKINSLGT